MKIRQEQLIKESVEIHQLITESEVSEIERREAEEFSKGLFNSSTIGIYIIQDGKFQLVNPQFQKATGYSEDELLGIDSLMLVHPEDRDIVRKNAVEMLKGVRSNPYQFRIINKSRKTEWVMEGVTPIRYRGRRAALGNFMEITKRKRAEEEKEKLQAQLLWSQKMEAIGTLAVGVAHDFNNLLTVIQGNIEFAMKKVDEANPLSDNLKTIHQAALRAANLTSQLLLFGRKQLMKRKSININDTVNDLIKMLNRLIGEDFAINTDLEPNLWVVKADAGNIEQVIMNLVVNARDAMLEGGEITIKTENVYVDESYCKIYSYALSGKFVCLSVTDTGMGMDMETIKRIFEPFFSTKEAVKGTGLGLSVVYGIVKHHEGWINVYSETGIGTTLRVYLPAYFEKLKDETKEIISLQELQGKGERILVVEDEEEVRKVAALALGENGYIIFEAADAEDALNIFEREKENFDLVFSDVVLPDKTGLQLVDQLLSRKPELRVLLSSGYANDKSQWPIMRERGYRFIQKPYALSDLIQAIREAIETS